MTRPNLPTLRSVAADPAVLVSLPLDAFDALLTEADAETKIIAAAKKNLTAALENRYREAIAGAYQADGKDFGTVHVADGEYDIEVNTPKKAEWDQDKLADLFERIKFSGENPSDYIKVSYAVSETAFGSWPDIIRKNFEPARTLKPGARTLKLARSKAEAA